MTSLAVYLYVFIGIVFLSGVATYASSVRRSQGKMDPALLMFLGPVWPVGVIVLVVIVVRKYYFKSNRKEGDDR